jgi:hypothetical protein
MNIIEMANESGLVYYGMGKDRAKFLHHLEAFAALIAAQEREACIKLVHAGTGEPVQTKTLLILQKDRKRIEDAIRARGTT